MNPSIPGTSWDCCAGPGNCQKVFVQNPSAEASVKVRLYINHGSIYMDLQGYEAS